MRYNTAIKLITSVTCSLDGRMKFTYDLTKPDKFKLKIFDSVNGELRIINFSLKKGIKKTVEVKFKCEGFRINFPLIKNVERFTFNIHNFSLMIKNGIKINEDLATMEPDLDVEF